jgi:hypothetical protein
MHNFLNLASLAALGARFAILGVGRYALPVRFRIRGSAVDCQVPTWSGVGDLLEEPGEVTLVALGDGGTGLKWLFIRGQAAVVPNPDWEGLNPVQDGRVGSEDLFHVVRVIPKRIEFLDEERGWGFRETVDL